MDVIKIINHNVLFSTVLVFSIIIGSSEGVYRFVICSLNSLNITKPCRDTLLMFILIEVI